MTEHQLSALVALRAQELAHLATLPPPIVRVCGPLTCDGSEGYERNATRLKRAEEILTSRG